MILHSPFVQAYITCALWSTNDNSTEQGGDPLDRNYSASDIHPDTLARMIADCKAFQADNEDDIATAKPGREWSGIEQAGHGFWLSRNGHGAGFFDAYKGNPYPDDVADRLQAAAEVCGEFDLYVGDDGQVHGN